MKTAIIIITGLMQANRETRFLVDIYVLKTMIYCQNLVSLRKSLIIQPKMIQGLTLL